MISSTLLALAAAPLLPVETLKVPTATHPTIASAVTAAQSGDTIQIAPNNAPGSNGVYFESVAVPPSKTGLRFVGSGNVIWDGSLADTLTVVGPGNDNVLVQGIHFRNGYTQVSIQGSHAEIRKCSFVASHGGSAIKITGNFAEISDVTVRASFDSGIHIQGGDASITRSTFEHLDFPGIHLVNADRTVVSGCKFSFCYTGIHVVSGTDVRITKNTIQNCGGNGIQFKGAGARIESNKIGLITDDPALEYVGCGIYSDPGSDEAVITGNTISSTTSLAIAVQGRKAVVTKNKIMGSRGAIKIVDASGSTGIGPTVAGNKIQRFGTAVFAAAAILVQAEEPSVSSNAVDGGEGAGIKVTGTGATITGNKIANVNGGIAVSSATIPGAPGPTILGNTVQGSSIGNGILVYADTATIVGNTIDRIGWPHFGIWLHSPGLAPQAGQVSENKVTNALGVGIYNLTSGVVLANNIVSDCGFSVDTSAGIRIEADHCSLTGNVVSRIAGDGFRIESSLNHLSECIAKDCANDGFDLASGAGNSLEACVAIGCAGEGLDNSSGVTGTSVQNCSFTKCRIDFAGNGGLSTNSNNTYETGGPNTAPQLELP